MNKKQNIIHNQIEIDDFLTPIYSLPITSVWRGYGNVNFIELGSLTDNRGEYTLWVDTSYWKLIETGNVFDGNEETYESIDSETSKLLGKKITKIDHPPESKIFEADFEGGMKLVCFPDEDHFVSIIRNPERKHLNFNSDGTTTFETYKPQSGFRD